jgi:hypothetical protein
MCVVKSVQQAIVAMNPARISKVSFLNDRRAVSQKAAVDAP